MDTLLDDSGTGAETFLQLTLGRTRLLVPRAELLALAATPDVRPADTGNNIGTVMVQDTVLPVYNFDEQLQLLDKVQDSRTACACLGNGVTAFGLLCDKAEVVNGAGMRVVALPACMVTSRAPVQSLALQGSRIYCLSDTAHMAGLLPD